MLDGGREERDAGDVDTCGGAEDGYADGDCDAHGGEEVRRDRQENRVVVAVARGHEGQYPARVQERGVGD